MYYVAKIDGKRMWENKEDITPIISYLESYSKEITGIELSSNSLGYDAAVALSESIKNLHNLEHVNYRDIFVSRKKVDLPKSLFALIEAIKDKNIKRLDLSDNAFGPIGITAFDFFLSKTTTLKELYLENNGLGPEGSETLANCLLMNEGLKLEVLHINRNRLEDKGAIAFAKYIEKTKSLKNIEIFQNGIRQEGMIQLLKAFKANTELVSLKINDNIIKKSANYLIDAVSNLKNLEILDVSDSLLGDEYSVQLFKTLSLLPNIKEIYCNYNEIEEKETQKCIFEICLSIESLKVVQLKGNDIDVKTWKKFKKDLINRIKFDPYSDEEEVDLGSEEENITNEIEKLNINK